ncbi:MAG: hypothetical protein IKG21_13240 [Atopobiaceae bacterium]|nr:hypothetical protein [Atopobiaceae bacterium]
MAEISKITLPTGTTYDLKDAHARELISDLQSYSDYLGVTTTALTDGATTNPITINSASVTAVKGNIVNYGSKEFIFSGTAWQLFGDLSALGALAYKDSASGSGTVAVPKTYTTTVTPAAKDVSVTGTTTGSVTETKGTVTVSPASSGTATYTPEGSNSPSQVIGSCTVTPSGSISVGTGTANYTPEGSISVGTGTANYTPEGTISKGNGTANYTPEGTVSTPTVTVTPSTTNKYVAASATGGGSVSAGTAAACTLPQLSTSVANETLTIGWDAGSFTANTPTAVTLPSFSQQTIATGISSASATQPTFTGTGAELKFTGTGAELKFTGTGKQLKFTGNTVSGTIEGEAAAQVFTGTGKRLKTDSQVLTGAAFAGASMTSTGSYTPATPTATTTTATTESKAVNVTVS